MRTILLALAILPLSACGLADSAINATKERDATAKSPDAVTLPIPPKAEPATAPDGLSQDDRFRKDFVVADRFVTVSVPGRLDLYVLDRTTGCVYSQDEKRGRDPVLLESGRPDCTYAER